MPYDIKNLDKFDEKFKGFFNQLTKLWAKVAEVKSSDVSGVDVSVPFKNFERIKTFILQDRQEAYNAGRKSGLEEVEKEIQKLSVSLCRSNWQRELHTLQEFLEIINKLKQTNE